MPATAHPTDQLIEVPTPSGPMRAFVSVHEPASPVVFLLMDVWGMRQELYDIARSVSSNGYTCIVPDFYHRQGVVSHEVRDENGRMRTLRDLPEEHQERIRTSLRLLRDDDVVEDVAAACAYLERNGLLEHAHIGCVGYCMGGRHAFRLAAAFPDRFVASASLHGSDLVTDRSDSPHLDIPQMRGSMYCGYAGLDPYAAPPVRKALDDAFARSSVRYAAALHTAARHGYALPERDVYDHQATTQDWASIYDMFRREISRAS